MIFFAHQFSEALPNPVMAGQADRSEVEQGSSRHKVENES